MGDLSTSERGQIVGAHLARASVMKSATLLELSRATVSKIRSVYMNHGKITKARRNNGQKSTLAERNYHTLRRIVSKNHTTTPPNLLSNGYRGLFPRG
jgi:hypothetical protein